MEGIQIEVRFPDGEVVRTTIKRKIFSSGDLIVNKVKSFTRFEFMRNDDDYYLSTRYLDASQEQIKQHGCYWIDGYLKSNSSYSPVNIRRITSEA